MIELSNISSHVTPLLKHIHAECDARRKTVEDQAEADIKAIKEKAEAEKQALWEAGIAGLNQLKQEIMQSTVKHARLDCDLRVKRKLSQATESLIVSVRDKLEAFAASDRFTPVMEQLVSEALKTAQTLCPSSNVSLGTLKVPPQHEALAKSIVKSQGVNVSVVADPSVPDGAVLTIDGTRYTITNTLSSRITKRENQIRMAIAQLLNAKMDENS